MATITKQTIYLDLTPGRVFPVLHVSQGDTGLEALEFKLVQNGMVFNIPAAVTDIQINGTTPLGVFSYNHASGVNWSGNTVTAAVTQTMTEEAGMVVAELVLLDSAMHSLGSLNFLLSVEPSPYIGAHVSVSDMASISASLNAAQQNFLMSKSWAVGDTGLRDGEATNNSKYWAGVAEDEKELAAQYGSGLKAQVDTNSARITQEVNDRSAAVLSEASTRAAAISSEASTRSAAVSSLQSQINQYVKPSTQQPDEVVNARVGADGTTYSTLGDAVRGQVTDLKSALNKYVEIEMATWISGKAYHTPNSVTSITPSNMIDVPTFSCTAMAISPGDKVILTGTGGSGSKLWVWTKADGTIIDPRAESNITLTDATLTAPAQAAWLLSSVDSAKPHRLMKSISVDERIDTAKKLSMIRDIGQCRKHVVKDRIVDLLNCLRSIPGKEMSSAVFYKTSVFDYEDYSTDLNISTLFEPLRVRDTNGRQIASIHCQLDAAKYKTAIIAYGYKADGTNDKPYRAEDVVDDILTLSNTTYYLVLHEYSNLDLLIGIESSGAGGEYHVGAGYEFETFHSCLTALKDNDLPKTIHVYGGTYDILSEMGGETFLEGLSASDNWYDVCDIIPPNTHIIGHGNVIFDLTIPAGTSADIAVLLSPINMMGSATIENVTINCNGGRYCIHAEGERMTAFNNAVWRILNCKINKSGNLTSVANAIGVGINNGDLLEIRNCVITNDGNAGLLVHDQQNNAGEFAVSPRILVDGCAIDVSAYPIVMSSTHSGSVSGAVLEMTVINCYCNNKFMRKIGSGKKDVFHATYINTPHRTQNQDGIIDMIADTEYNNFALT